MKWVTGTVALSAQLDTGAAAVETIASDIPSLALCMGLA